MVSNPKILVVGAGASGLAFALECAHRGIKPRIIDKRPNRSMIEKATGVAAGVWSQLSKFGVSPKTVETAIPMRNFAFYDDGELVANVPVPPIDGCPPAHLYPQGELERHLERALAIKGVEVEYSTAFHSYEESKNSILVRAQVSSGEIAPLGSYDWVIGADGAHSAVREAAEIPFIGRNYPENWSVAEITTNQWPQNAQAQLFLQSNGVGLFLSQPAAGLVQGILNDENAARQLTSLFTDAELRYERHFTVALKRVRTPRKGRVWVIGDAAHVQSPVGGQGLNLAIWDGVTLAEGLLAGDLKVEAALAKRARKVLFFTDFDYRMLATQSTLIRNARNTYWAYAAKHPSLARWFFKIISGVW
ncbi:2-polyprenyl-6-methoxyphenol hydroxylase-like FAD-dependent oxidoreductase [Marinobacterium halophilum]|uniref:2-polyprenyl-6-methoxyphenol hydroxylase-like FAD-dependent oxidoreductase n=1 Tax=Marinobacterium halophilum TaxID=267374 RepID=A0A2P8F2E6_9GAMM|nr:NAD(P)/FAD-dependent oxidoreductase [Marinobacterium halophilum]PSL15898.1 2-polyprenyl-6-methoxyphenol hydroxylase-like FAD-dependent oxidoreductase [Marinobacterium halophilum]